MLDLYKLIADLTAKKEHLDAAIAALEAVQSDSPKQHKRRGRKSMGPDERQAVSERMKRYWAAKVVGDAGPGLVPSCLSAGAEHS